PTPSPLFDSSTAGEEQDSSWPFVLASGSTTESWPKPPGFPVPPDVWQGWKWHTDQWIRALLEYYRRGNSGGGGGRKNRDECRDRWDREYARCSIFRPYGYRYQQACEARANQRLSLCQGNGGKPHPQEPEEYSWQDIPRDSPER